MTAARRARVQHLLDAAGSLVDPNTELGRRAREELPTETGLSPENVALCLEQHLESRTQPGDLDTLLNAATPCRKAHVLLSANVFTAPMRAIALALAQSQHVDVRPSRRQPLFTRLLWEACGGAFRIVDELVPAPDDHVWAYGRDVNLEVVRGEMPEGVLFHAHASGFGVITLGGDEAVSEAVAAIVRDIVPFDQRGCLSPRILLSRGSPDFLAEVAEQLARELLAARDEVPLGTMSPNEAAEVTRYRDTMTYAGSAYPAGKGIVGLDLSGNVLLSPVGRSLHIARVDSFESALAQLRDHVTSVSARPELHAELATLVPRARISDLGRQQRPPLDGPVDQRPLATGDVL